MAVLLHKSKCKIRTFFTSFNIYDRIIHDFYLISGSTGPLLLFDESLYQFCKSNDIEYLTTRVYIGMWLGIIALFVALFEGSVFVKLFTRFTEEIFSALISLLYIVESVMKLIYVYGRHPIMEDYCSFAFIDGTRMFNDTFDFLELNDSAPILIDSTLRNHSTAIGGTTTSIQKIVTQDEHGPINQPNTALFCTILALGTFAIAYYLRLFRNSQFLGRSVSFLIL